MLSFISNLSVVEIVFTLLIFAYLYVFAGYCTQDLWYQYERRTRWNWRLLVGAGWPIAHLVYAFIFVVTAILNMASERREVKRKGMEHAHRAPHVS